MESGYKILEHPADMGIEAFGKNLKSAFEQSAIALVSIIMNTSEIETIRYKQIEIYASDYEHLLVRWLSEILYIYDGEKFAPSKFKIEMLTSNFLKAKISGENFKKNKHTTNLDVKAITYHQIFVEENSEGARVRVFLDI